MTFKEDADQWKAATPQCAVARRSRFLLHANVNSVDTRQCGLKTRRNDEWFRGPCNSLFTVNKCVRVLPAHDVGQRTECASPLQGKSSRAEQQAYHLHPISLRHAHYGYVMPSRMPTLFAAPQRVRMRQSPLVLWASSQQQRVLLVLGGPLSRGHSPHPTLSRPITNQRCPDKPARSKAIATRFGCAGTVRPPRPAPRG